jgi:hypothetical protein
MGPTTALVHAWSGSQSQTHGSSMNTADPLPCTSGHTADGVPTIGASRRGKSFFSAVRACRHTADPLPCPYHVGTRQTVSAVVVTTVTSLPYVRTRQTVCRVQKHLCRVYGTHGRPLFSGSAWHCIGLNVNTLGYLHWDSMPIFLFGCLDIWCSFI